MFIKDITDTLDSAFPQRWQEDFDNSGLQVGEVCRQCSGVMICVDVTPQIVVEAYNRGCNLIVSHHPLIFHPLKRITGYDRVDRAIVHAIKNDITIYSCHTPVDNAPQRGVSWRMAQMLSLTDIAPLESRTDEHIGSGIIASLPRPMTPVELVEHIKATFGTTTARCSDLAQAPETITRIALCGGAGSFLIPQAIARGAQAFICADNRHNHFIDYLSRIFLVDIGHYESEQCTKQIFYQIITEKFPNFAVCYSELENNPINYL
jgi:dinuclear metal center YbgI/SA1388 family protein